MTRHDQASPALVLRLFSPVDIASLVFFRLVFGATVLTGVITHFANGFIQAYFIDPKYHFAFYGFEWLKPFPGDWMYVVFAVLGVLALLVMAGLYYHVSATLLFLVFTYQFLLDEACYRNHYYLLSLISALMIFVPAHRAASLDVWRGAVHAQNTAPAWYLWLLRAQIGIVYFFGGIAKCNADWLSGVPMGLMLADAEGLPALQPYLTRDWVIYGFAHCGLLLDLLIVPALLWRRTRIAAFAASIVFHFTNGLVLFEIGVFPWFMILATMLYFDASWPRRLLWRLRPQLRPCTAPSAQAPQRTGTPLSGMQITVVVMLSAYLAIQVLVPLRHYLYPGRTAWTDQGHRWAWHMKLNNKIPAMPRFTTVDPSTGKTYEVPPAKFLTPLQIRRMATRPDMILQFAHWVHEHQLSLGYDFEVHAFVVVSLNGREPRRLIDHEVNLAGVQRSLWPADWILPLGDVPLPYIGLRRSASTASDNSNANPD